MTRQSLILIFATLALFSRIGIAGQGQEIKAPPAPAPQVSVATDDVVVKVLGEAVTEKQVLNLIDQIANSQQPPLPPDQVLKRNVTFYHEALDTLVGGILLKNEAKEKNIVPDKAKVDEAMQAVKSRFANEEAYQKALGAQGIKDADVRRSVEDRMVIQEILAQTLKGLPLASDAEIQKFYTDNPKYFEQPEQIHASMVFLKFANDATPEQKAALKSKLEGIRADIEAKKITFAEAATKYSEDPKTAASGGDLGFFKRGEFLAPLEKVAFATKPGALAPITETQFGYHLIQVVELKPSGVAPLDEAVKTNIKNYLEQKTGENATKKHVEELKSKVKVETVMTDEEWNKRHAGK